MKEVPLQNFFLYKVTEQKLLSKFLHYPAYLLEMARDRSIDLAGTDRSNPKAIIQRIMEWKVDQENCGSDEKKDAFRKLRSQWRTTHRNGTKRSTEYKDSFTKDVPIPEGCVSANDVRALSNAATVVAVYGVESPESDFEHSIASRLKAKMAVVLESLRGSDDCDLISSFVDKFTKWFFGLVQMASKSNEPPEKLSVYSTFLKVRCGDTICIHACALSYPHSLFFSNRRNLTMPSAAWTLLCFS